MAPLCLVGVLAVALMAATVTADDSNQGIRVWAAAAYITHGERTPPMGGLQTILTPEGAQQMWRQGSAFRSRYLTGGANGSQSAVQGMARDAIDNAQLSVLSQADEWVAAGAMAFMQGLYPPKTDVYVGAAGGQVLGHDYADGRNTTDYPLEGYQYPWILTVPPQESSSIGLQGDVGCPAWQSEMETNLRNSRDTQDQVDQYRSLYQTLFSSAPLQGVIPLVQASYENAAEIYELVKYMYTHNETVFNGLDNAQDTLNTLQALAFASERAKTSHNSTNPDDSLHVLYSIAGRTLASQVANDLVRMLAADGGGGKMTLLFGSARPLLSFFSVGGLLTRQNLVSGPFSRLPEPGAAMIFEVISDSQSSTSGSSPAMGDLKVRFYYRATANANETFATYPLFGSGFDGAIIPYASFVRRMRDRGSTPSGWCDICSPRNTVYWCVSPSCAKPSISPVVGGIIGAVLTAALAGIITLVYHVLQKRRTSKAPRDGSAGGFRGAQRRPADADVALSKGGVREERIGSWEMRARDKNEEPTSDIARAVTKDCDTTWRERDDGDGISITGPPVKPRESV
ncbi:histidine phosphatase superfamily (branch 2) domain-containing protein [Hirsutella rhossiliensis]|uniref:Histidine phosphatase superfamily (Branch 2) domain-containing protein n=1 Tax=Hirsutella rhossiliensis TaxID=111463 RepID=A0A9P8N3Y4_9HYPO|nr:histidine phosphatase superfamily (branch 2) domain-containing protein [Hirsutella rhossiliensis]KAH0966400.1 histidine phosphatase superfamily (branch 2) domain-containing protein [Hirsutella rhossiliensis]